MKMAEKAFRLKLQRMNKWIIVLLTIDIERIITVTAIQLQQLSSR